MKSALLRTVAVLALSIALAALLRAEQAQNAPAPAWKLKDVDGNLVTSAQFKGKVVVLDFWATWCPPCKSEIPGYVGLQKKYAADGLVIVGISTDEDGPKRQATVKDFMAAYRINYTIVMTDGDVENAFGGIDAIPTTFIIDRDGRIRFRKVGAMPEEEFEKQILAVLRPAP
jgi:peroxiredoxin